MAGKFLNRLGLLDSKLSERTANSARKRKGQVNHPIHAYKCSCSSESCGAGYFVDDRFTIPSAEDCKKLMRARKLGFDHDKWHPRDKNGKLVFSRVIRRSGQYVTEYFDGVNTITQFTLKDGRYIHEFV